MVLSKETLSVDNSQLESLIEKLDENSAQFILQGALDYLTKEKT